MRCRSDVWCAEAPAACPEQPPEAAGWPAARGYCWRCGAVEPIDTMRFHTAYHRPNRATFWQQRCPTCAGCVSHVWCTPTTGALCAPDAAAPATPDDLRRLAREVLPC